MNILVACEKSQVVTCALRAKGHNAFSCDIQDCSGGYPEWHIKGDVLEVLNPNVEYGDPFFSPPYERGIEFRTCTGDYHFVENRWDMILLEVKYEKR